MIFDSGSNFDSLNDDLGSRFIYIWLSVDDSRSRISVFFFNDFMSRSNLWLVTRGQELILIERWFALLWGLNDWFWSFFFNVLMKICPWGSFSMKIFFFIVRIFGNSHCEDFLFWEIFRGVFFFLIFSLRLFYYEYLFNA